MDMDISQAIEMYKQGSNYEQIGEHFGLSAKQVGRRLRHTGFRAERKLRHPSTIPLPMDEIAARYQAGESSVALAKAFGTNSERMRRRLHNHGVQFRSLLESRARGEKNSQYKGGKSVNRADMHHQVRSLVERLLDLPEKLPRTCVVHHIDENPRNNSVENLALFVSFGSHLQHHQRLLKSQYRDCPAEATQLLLESGGVLLQSLLDQTRSEPGTSPLFLLETMALQQQNQQA